MNSPITEKSEDIMGKKNKIKNTKITSTISRSDGWNGDDFKISYKDALEIGNFRGAKLYGHINEKYDADTRWELALSKGFAGRAKGSNGVKYLEKKLLELKINDGDRIYTSKIYQNEKGDYLACFKDDTNHKGIDRILNATKELDIIPVQDYHIDEENIIDVIGNQTSLDGDF